jgi:hypothetical protein
MVIGENGTLAVCRVAYDSRVGGVVSGAGELETAFVMNKQDGHRAAIALIGTVYCQVDASSVPVIAGEMLTTSTRLGMQ